MTQRILIVTMIGLGLGLSTLPAATMSPGLAKGLSWLVAGTAKYLK